MNVQQRKRGFSLVELLVVTGIVAMLISLLMPALTAARRQALSTKCKANLRSSYMFMLMYANDNRGWYAPPGLGTNVPMASRWPVRVFTPPTPTPRTLLCPADAEPAEQHSFVLNCHVLEKSFGFGSRPPDGRSVSDIILMGEKKSDQPDYYMELERGQPSEFNRLVELYRHGFYLGSNCLMLDGSVSAKSPKQVAGGFDPWDIPSTPSS